MKMRVLFVKDAIARMFLYLVKVAKVSFVIHVMTYSIVWENLAFIIESLLSQIKNHLINIHKLNKIQNLVSRKIT